VKRIQVAVGILTEQSGEVLVGQRLVEDDYFQKWEFPGGKLEPNETPEQALIRELKEELDIEVRRCKQLMTLDHDYPDRRVRLHVLLVLEYRKSPSGKEGQALQWVALDALQDLDFLAGNQPIIEKLKTLR
jgi:8-oxo-dGTP diphosphatase